MFIRLFGFRWDVAEVPAIIHTDRTRTLALCIEWVDVSGYQEYKIEICTNVKHKIPREK